MFFIYLTLNKQGIEDEALQFYFGHQNVESLKYYSQLDIVSSIRNL